MLFKTTNNKFIIINKFDYKNDKLYYNEIYKLYKTKDKLNKDSHTHIDKINNILRNPF
jgi:hypothetical protein